MKEVHRTSKKVVCFAFMFLWTIRHKFLSKMMK